MILCVWKVSGGERHVRVLPPVCTMLLIDGGARSEDKSALMPVVYRGFIALCARKSALMLSCCPVETQCRHANNCDFVISQREVADRRGCCTLSIVDVRMQEAYIMQDYTRFHGRQSVIPLWGEMLACRASCYLHIGEATMVQHPALSLRNESWRRVQLTNFKD
jgi:hypothetical protein